MQIALGFRTHSGWAAVVAVGLSPELKVYDRREIVLADPKIRGSKQPFHEAEPMPLPKAKDFLKRCTDRSYQLAADSLMVLVRDMDPQGHEVVVCGAMAGSGRKSEPIEKILASHAAIHRAEGELYREAIAHACKQLDLPLVKVREKEAYGTAQIALNLSRDEIDEHLASLGRTLGSPWTQDQKLATLAAWVALAEMMGAQRRSVAVTA